VESLSVLMLSFNHDAFVEAAVRSALDQQSDSLSVDVRIIDDGSTDGSPKTLQRLAHEFPDRVTLHLQKHEGPAAIARNLNRLIRTAGGEYVSFLASDDQLLPAAFEAPLRSLRLDPGVALVYSDGVNVYSDGSTGPLLPEDEISVLRTQRPECLLRFLTTRVPRLYVQGLVARTNFLRSFEPFDDALIADDWVFNIRSTRELIQQGRTFAFSPQRNFLRHVLPQGTARNVPVHTRRITQVADTYLQPPHRQRVKAAAYLKLLKWSWESRMPWRAASAYGLYASNDPGHRELIRHVMARGTGRFRR
jgi:glycosyltransferase involved in cell wall biosynthesis